MATYVRDPMTADPRTVFLVCPDCGHQLRRTDMLREGDHLVLHLECPSCGYKRKRSLA
jgi:predicted RNA-binding Zn-ribbon protein involved in translation (DUF1610 family)